MTRGLFWINFALLVFVMIAVSLSVTWFVFYKKTAELVARNDQIVISNQQKDGIISSLNSERDRLKAMIGSTPETSTADVLKQKDDLMKQYAQNFKSSNQSYSKTLANFYNQIESQNYSIANNKSEIADLSTFNQSRDELNLVRSESVKSKLSEKINEDADKQTSQLESMLSSLDSFKKQVDDLKNKSTGKNSGSTDKLNKEISKLVEDIKSKIKETRSIRDNMEKVEVAANNNSCDGYISYISAASGKASINIGRADGVSNKTTFSVYDSHVTDFANSSSKGSIEVVLVTGEHVADCRVLSDDPSDPIIPGDKIYSPVWDPGFQEHFAIVGTIDFDYDGSDDLMKLISLIERNGGVIDGYQLGDSQKGRLMDKTGYLIMGSQPEESSTDSFRATYSNFIKAADTYNTKKISVRELLMRMGYDPSRSNVVRYEGNQNPDTFRPRPQEGVNRSNGASLSPLFQDENDRDPIQAVPFQF